MSFSPCDGCPSLRQCKALARWKRLDCATMKATYQPRERHGEPGAVVNNGRVELLEAAQIVIRHWDLYQERGMDAAIELLRRVVARQ